jgi:hypothetical protein
MNTTLVTFYFDLGKLENNPKRRSRNIYDDVSETLLKRNMNLFFIGSDQDIVDHVNRVREKYNLLNKTHCEVFDIQDSPYYKYLSELQNLYDGDGLCSYKGSLHWTPMYFVCIYTKMYALKMAIEKNVFDTQYFCWHDYGLAHVSHYINDVIFEETLNSFNDESVKILLLNPVSREWSKDRESFYKNDNYIVTAQFYGGSKDNMMRFINRFDEELIKSIEVGRPCNEENVMAMVVADYPNEFDVSCGYYSTAMKNVYIIRDSYDKVLPIISGLRTNGYDKLSYDISDKVFKGLKRGEIKLSDIDIYNLYKETIITSYYVKGVIKYREYVREFKEFCERVKIEIDEGTKGNLIY